MAMTKEQYEKREVKRAEARQENLQKLQKNGKPLKISKRGRVNEGRPSKYADIDLKKVELYAGFGMTAEQIATLLEISSETIIEWKNKYPEFASCLSTGRTKADIAVVQSMYRQAVDGNITAQIFWLKNRLARQWRDRQDFEHTGKDGGAIALDITAMTAAERQARIAELEKKRLTDGM